MVEDRYALRAMDVASRSRLRAEAALRRAGHQGAPEGEEGDIPPTPTLATEATATRTMAPVKTYTQSLTITGCRVFHWEVAVRRNLCSLALLSFVTMWVLLLDSMYPIPLDSSTLTGTNAAAIATTTGAGITATAT